MIDACQICKKPISEWNLKQSSTCTKCETCGQYPATEYYSGLCSSACERKFDQARSDYRFYLRMKWVQNMTYDSFRTFFEFNEAGGYAEGKWNLMCKNVIAFLHTLDRERMEKLLLKDI